jgi:BirA family transcriptional regulator, biotin operon repressor / biotin---[acetyl-CoA-carboxylase] ligase
MEPVEHSGRYPEWLHWLEQCPSTNTWAIAHLSTLDHGAVVFTERQTAGRGQQGRIWHAPPGVLTLSIVLHHIPVESLPSLSLVAGLAVIYAIEDLIPALQGSLRLKWPNDVLANGQKLAGILCESVVSRSAGGQVVVGIGLNHQVNFSHPDVDPQLIKTAISLHQLAATPDAFSLIQRLRHYLLQTAGLMRWQYAEANLQPEPPAGLTALLPALRQRDALLGQPITVELTGERLSGYACGISDRGYLLLGLPDGSQRSITSGHVLKSVLDD